MNDQQIKAHGDALYQALVLREPIAPLTEQAPDLTLDEAYAIQQRMIGHRLASGERVIGKKVGVTSRAVQEMLNVHQPDFGWLLSGMLVAEGDAIDLGTLIQPRAEGEIAFLLKRDLEGPGVTAADVLAATEGVMACFEIVDSRIRDWRIRIGDTVADNASCGMIVLGDRVVDPRRVDLALAGMALEKNGELECTGAGAAALGHPLNCVAWLANTLGRLGIGLKAGEIILSGSLGKLVSVASGDALRVSIGGIGSASVRFR